MKTGGSFARSGLPPALTTTSYNANNQQTTFGTNTITYDLNGNLATATDAGVTTTYTWNARNQLAGISATGFAASFTYDSFGRRTGKTIQGTTTNFVYDGLNPVQEKNGGTVTANLLVGLGIDEFLTRTDGVGTSALLPDALGSTIALGDGTGTIQTQYTYEPFGSVSQTGSANTSNYKYTGREDDGSGLYYYRARYYHPRLQRFISEDPIGFSGGINKYSYGLNNPSRFVDPHGLIHGVPGSACPASRKCHGKARVLGGNPNTVGAQGAFPGTTVQAGSAAVIPQQFGSGKGGLSPYIGQISGSTAGGQSFNGISDVIGGKSPTPGVNVRDALQAMYPGLPIIELPTGRDEGIVDVEIMVPGGLPCPVGTVEQSTP